MTKKSNRRWADDTRRFIPVNPTSPVEPTHYTKFTIEPFDFIHKNQIGFAEGNVIKYICRWRDKDGIKDLKKAMRYIELIIEGEKNETDS